MGARLSCEVGMTLPVTCPSRFNFVAVSLAFLEARANCLSTEWRGGRGMQDGARCEGTWGVASLQISQVCVHSLKLICIADFGIVETGLSSLSSKGNWAHWERSQR